ncbi:MAG: DUF502 domain-containing protein [Chitinispirillaceae bacterium]|nr:DUF502 domain-containing protein [Chitinispirillaceae bacterium]
MANWLFKRFFKQVRNNILTGIFLIIPVIGSVWILTKLFIWADSALPAIFGQEWFVGMGLLVTLILAYIMGLATKNWLGRKVIATGNYVIVSIPILNKIYLLLKQIIETATTDRNKLFEKAVLVEYPKSGSYCIGFVTSENNEVFSAKTAKHLSAVFVPTTPNPTSGFLLYVAQEDIIPLDIPVEVAIKIIVSVGLLNTERQAEVNALPKSLKHWNWMDIFKKKKRHGVRNAHHDLRD